MARGGYRPGAGRPKGPARKKKSTPEKVAERTLKAGQPSTKKFNDALDFAMHVINDPEAALDAKIRLAVAALPFQHPKLDGAAPGKKEQREKAAQGAAAGKFAPPAPPKLVVDNK